MEFLTSFPTYPSNYNPFFPHIFFSIWVFLHTKTDDSRDSKGKKGQSSLPFSIFHLHPLTNIQILICKFADEMAGAYF